MKNWIKLYTTRNYVEASIIKGMLEENNVAVVMMNKVDSSYLVFGYIDLYVPAHIKEIAKNLIDETISQ